MRRLSLSTLGRVPGTVRRPAYDPATLGCGIVHLGVGAFHRAHQAVFTEDAVEKAGGAWGIVGVSLRRPDAAAALTPQDGLYTLELRSPEPAYRVIGVLRQALAAQVNRERVLETIAAPTTHVLTLTVTERGYAYGADGALDLADRDVAHDLSGSGPPRSTVGWLVEGLARRRACGGGGLTVMSCDNLRSNGRKLLNAVQTFADRRKGSFARWIEDNTTFPDSMVDAITPASDAALLARVAAVIGLEDRGCVQREPFAQWVIEDHFAGPRPTWERAGAELVIDVAEHEALKLHVLNAAHSALAYFGLPRGHALVREAIANPDLAARLNRLVADEISPALADQGISAARTAAYWRGVRARFAEPGVDHRLDQIARDGAAKLRERIHPLLSANVRSGRTVDGLAHIVAAWLAYESRSAPSALDDPALFDTALRGEADVRAAILAAADASPSVAA